MKLLKNTCLFTFILCLFSGILTTQETALIKIDPDRKIDTIDPNIYGAFVEPIRTVVYGNIYDPESPFADEKGLRKDFINLIKELNVRNVCWPGGNFVSGYNWDDGIGPNDQRLAKLDLAWKQIETNQMGTDEYASGVLPGRRENDVFSDHMSLGLQIDEKIETTQASIQKAMVKSDSERPVYISFEEYSPGFGGIRSALLLAQHLNSFIRHAEIVKMANITMITGLTGHSPEGVFKNSLFHTFDHYSNNALGTVLDVYTDTPSYNNEIFDNIPYLDVTAIFNKSDRKVIINMVNRHETDAIETKIDLQAGEYAGKATVKVINADNLEARNTIDESPVSVETNQINFKGNVIKHTFPGHSFTQIEIATK